jgi:hypothetical protein
MKQYIKQQIEWLKLFFAEDKLPTSPSHKNLIGIVLVAVFAIAFLKKIAGSPDIPDIPAGWQLVILGLLGIRSIQAATEKFIETKSKENGTKQNGQGMDSGNP